MKHFLMTAVLGATLATGAFAEPVKYVLDPSHSQIIFNYNHLGFSTTTGMFSGFDGTIMMDAENPEASSVEVSIPANSFMTGWQERDDHFQTPDFFGVDDNPAVEFKSTEIEVSGENTGKITGDLTMNGITKPVVLDAKMTQMGEHPMEQKPWAGFDATTTIKRSDFDMGQFAPYVSDEVEVMISIEATKAEE